MSLFLVAPRHREKYEELYRRGYDKQYPSLDLVRIERWYFQGKPGRVLDYGFGAGTNLIHLLERGYQVDGLETSSEAKRIVERKLAQRSDWQARMRLRILDDNAVTLPYADGTFDYVVCLSVLSLLESRERVERLLGELWRVMKPQAKMVVDINGPSSDFAKHAIDLGQDVYQYSGHAGEEEPRLYYCLRTAEQFRELLNAFVVDDVGSVSFRYLGNEDFEFIACVRKP